MKPERPPGMWGIYKAGGITPAVASIFNRGSAQQMAFIRSVMKEQRKRPLFEIQLETLQAVVFDLETTGFSPYNGDEIISVGAVAIEGQEVGRQETYYSTVNPKRRIPEEVVALTGLTDEEVSAAPDLLKVLHDFMEFIGSRVLIVHGSGHDKNFLSAALWKTSRTQLNHRILDTMMVDRLLYPKRQNRSLDVLLDMYGVHIDKRHHALDDSVATAEVWSKQLVELLDGDITTLGDLYTKLSVFS
ncbi:exonuclease domain-containing protein [Gorillibacterium massiliense]|uniref:exonuclease domain-containing protein n=1 Tax=Gorillibacterium massiliense TaxID=1280390 RepID=UPI0004B68C99|nr:exonuclease domain-containing protein [Gorillibacterium massiliense]